MTINKITQIIKNMEFFCKLANLKEFHYDVSNVNTLENSMNDIIFPSIGYYDTYFIKSKYILKS